MTCLQIESLADFKDIRDTVKIDFRGNHIQELSGIEGKNFNLRMQNIVLSGNFARDGIVKFRSC